MSVTHTKELEKILDEEINTAIKNEPKTQEIDKETIEEYERMERNQMQKDSQATNNEILKEALLNRSKTLDVNSSILNLTTKESEYFIEVMKELHFLKKHFGKLTITVVGIVFIAGYIMGTQHELLSPYLGKAWQFFTSFKPSGA